MSTQFRPLQIPPGVVATPTKKMSSSNWAEVNLVRWREQLLMPIGGMQKYPYTFASRCKKIHTWFGLDGVQRIAYLCETNLYVDAGGTLTDITPAGGLASPVFIQGGYGDGIYGQGTWVKTTAAFTTASPNITMVANPGTAAPGDDVYDVTTGQHVGTVSTYNGTALVLTANAASAGASGDTLNFGAYGAPRSLTANTLIDKVPDAYSLDNFGAILLAMTSIDGRLLFWDPASTPGTKAAPVVATSGRGTTPTGRAFVVTPERFVIIFGGAYDATNGGGFRRFAWCDQENFYAWDYSSVTSQAGFLDIEPASPILCAISTRTGTLFWTARRAYRSAFLGIPYVYNYQELANNCTPWSSQSMVNTSAMALWFSEQGAFSYDGTSILPVACMVRPWVDSDIDIVNVREQACAVHVENFNEFWWCFPQNGQPYNTRAIIYNYKEGWWSQARLARSAGVTASYNAHTLMANGTLAYQHEVIGQPYSADAMPGFVETFDFTGAAFQGGKLITVKQLMPDVEGDFADLRYSLFYSNSRSTMPDPSGATIPNPSGGIPVSVPKSAFVIEKQSPPVPVRPDGYVDFRVTGRDIRLRIDMTSVVVQPFTLGQHLIDAVSRGDR